MKNTRLKLARLTSNVLNPFLVSSSVIGLISLEATDRPIEAMRWALIAIGMSILPVLAVVFYLVRNGTLGNVFISARTERHRIYILSAVCVLVGALTLYFMGAPAVLVASFVAGLTSVVVFMLINLVWKISVHTAFVAASVTLMIMLFGAAASMSAFLVPLTGWSRIELKGHSFAEVTSGAVLAAAISYIVFYTSGLT